MRGFGYSFALLLVLALVLTFTPLWAVVGFFGGIPVAALMQILSGLPREIAVPTMIYLPGVAGIAAHFMFHFGSEAIRDSKYTLFSAGWTVTVWSIFRFFCYFDHGPSSIAAQRCSGFLPGI